MRFSDTFGPECDGVITATSSRGIAVVGSPKKAAGKPRGGLKIGRVS